MIKPAQFSTCLYYALDVTLDNKNMLIYYNAKQPDKEKTNVKWDEMGDETTMEGYVSQ
jgi:hypothetical protein